MSLDCQKLVEGSNAANITNQSGIWLTEIIDVDWTHIPEYQFVLLFFAFFIILFGKLCVNYRKIILYDEALKENYLKSIYKTTSGASTISFVKYCIENDIEYDDISSLNITLQSYRNGDKDEAKVPFEKANTKTFYYAGLCVWMLSAYCCYVFPYCIASGIHWSHSLRSYVEIQCIAYSETDSHKLYPDIDNDYYLYKFFMVDLCIDANDLIHTNTTIDDYVFYASMHYPPEYNKDQDFYPSDSDAPCYINTQDFDVRGRYKVCCGCDCSRCGRVIKYGRCCGKDTAREQLIATCYCLSFCCAPCMCCLIPLLFKGFDAVTLDGYEIRIDNIEKTENGTTCVKLPLRVDALKDTANNGRGKRGERVERDTLRDPASGSPKMNKDHEKVREWFKAEVNLEQYGSVFIENGFETLDFIKNIDMNVLNMMEIDKIGHKMRILQCIQELKDEDELAIADSKRNKNGRKHNEVEYMAVNVHEGDTAYI